MAERMRLYSQIEKAWQGARTFVRGIKSSLRGAGRSEKRPLLLLLEGKTDAEFLRRASEALQAADHTAAHISQLERSGQIIVIFTGGDIASWEFRLANLGSREFFVIDREDLPTSQRREAAARIINLRPGCRAVITAKRSIENYLHTDAIREARGVDVSFGDDDDVAAIVAERCFQLHHPQGHWSGIPLRAQRRLKNRAKSWLCTLAADRMTPDRFAERDPAGEIVGWLRSIREMAIDV